MLRRGFTLAPGERVLVVEDVVTRGGRVQECLDLIRRAGGTPAGIALLVDRSAGATKFDVPVMPLLELSSCTAKAVMSAAVSSSLRPAWAAKRLPSETT